MSCCVKIRLGETHYMMLLSMTVAIMTTHMVIVDIDVAIVHHYSLIISDLIGIKCMQVITHVVWRTIVLYVYDFSVEVSSAEWIFSTERGGSTLCNSVGERISCAIIPLMKVISCLSVLGERHCL